MNFINGSSKKEEFLKEKLELLESLRFASEDLAKQYYKVFEKLFHEELIGYDTSVSYWPVYPEMEKKDKNFKPCWRVEILVKRVMVDYIF